MTDQRIRLAFVGAAHVHFRGLMTAALASPTAAVVGVVEEDTELREHYVREFSGVPSFTSAEEMYDERSPQAIIICTDNRRAADVAVDAAARGIHVMKEKPMAATLALAEQMATAAARHGIRLMVNWPTNWWPSIHHAKKLVDEGRIGRVWQVHHRFGHGGPPPDYHLQGPASRVGWGWLIDRGRNGGGAYVDFCSYGAVFSRWVMGQPSRVVAMGGRYAKDFFTVDDNAVLILGYPKGHSVCEGTWTQPSVPYPIPIMIYGERGAIAITGQTELKLANRGEPGEVSSVEAETIEAPPLPDHYQSAPAYFTHCLLHDLPFEGIVAAEVSRDAQEILEAGAKSMGQGAEVGLPLKAFLA